VVTVTAWPGRSWQSTFTAPLTVPISAVLILSVGSTVEAGLAFTRVAGGNPISDPTYGVATSCTPQVRWPEAWVRQDFTGLSSDPSDARLGGRRQRATKMDARQPVAAIELSCVERPGQDWDVEKELDGVHRSLVASYQSIGWRVHATAPILNPLLGSFAGAGIELTAEGPDNATVQQLIVVNKTPCCMLATTLTAPTSDFDGLRSKLDEVRRSLWRDITAVGGHQRTITRVPSSLVPSQ
jgi:hypothetical protein